MINVLCDVCSKKITAMDTIYYLKIDKEIPSKEVREPAMQTMEVCPACFLKAKKLLQQMEG